MTPEQNDTALQISHKAAYYGAFWLDFLTKQLTNPDEEDRTTAALVIANFAAGTSPPVPMHTARALSSLCKQSRAGVTDSDLLFVFDDAIHTLDTMSHGTQTTPIWFDQLIERSTN